MLDFYKKLLVSMSVMLLLSGIILGLGHYLSHPLFELLPRSTSSIPWTPWQEPPEPRGTTHFHLLKDDNRVEFEYSLDANIRFPYAALHFEFADPNDPASLLDLTQFENVSFEIQCNQNNIQNFILFTFDDLVTQAGSRGSYRVSSTFFSCKRDWSEVVINLADLDTPIWWLDQYGLAITNRKPVLKQSLGFGVASVSHTQRNTTHFVNIRRISFLGHRPLYWGGSMVLCGLIWAGFCIWMVKQYSLSLTQYVRDNIDRSRPFVAYKTLSMEPQKDKDKDKLLKYLATEYTNPELNLEVATAALGLNRNKINEILKSELGLTFTAYLNKLRLTEAARVLQEVDAANVAEIAHSVGYNNVSYFNKLFKREYGCPPKVFKALSKE